jgi:RNA polymerase sigma-70 factor, ECF subfamily
MENSNHFMKQWEGIQALHRPFLVSFAFRMTGSLAEAEDIVQDTFLSCSQIDPTTIQNHKSWLTKICSNRGLDHLKTAYKKREVYHGTWLPDAVPESLQIWDQLNSNDSPDKNILISESLTTSFLLLIEKLNPEERVVFLLAEVFEYPYKDIADYLDKSEEACRKIAQRARKAVTHTPPVLPVKSESAQKLIAQFFDSARKGDRSALMSMLARDSEFWSDGGGKVAAVRTILKDPEKIADFFKGIYSSKALLSSDVKMETSFVNSRPGFIISRRLPAGDWTFESVMSFEIVDGKITRIYAQRNPDKLGALFQ